MTVVFCRTRRFITTYTRCTRCISRRCLAIDVTICWRLFTELYINQWNFPSPIHTYIHTYNKIICVCIIILVRRLKKRDRFENLDAHGTRLEEEIGIDNCASRNRPVAASREHGKESSGFPRRREIPLSVEQLTAAPLSYVYIRNELCTQSLPPRSEIRCLTGRTDLTAGASDSSIWTAARNICIQKAKPRFSIYWLRIFSSQHHTVQICRK
jgi:hypothetical protein